MLAGMAGVATGGGAGITGGASGPAESGQSIKNDIQTGFGGAGGFSVGDYYSRGSQVSKANQSLLNNIVVIGGILVAAIWLLKKK